MKITFKLTKEQLIAAKKIAMELENTVAEDKNEVWCGNLLGYQGHSFSFNQDQHLQLLDNGIVQYVGQRHPLLQDGGLLVLAKIAGFGDEFPTREDYQSPARKKWTQDCFAAAKQLVVVDYQTSDNELQWWETASDKAYRLLKENKVTVEMLEPIVEKYSRNKYLKQAEWAYMSVLEGVKPAPLGTPAYRQACAAGTQKLQLLAAKYQEAKNFWY